MRLIVDIPNEIYESQEFCKYFGVWSEKLQTIYENSVVIPENATNLDVFTKIFRGTPDIDTCPVFCISKDDVPCQFDVNTCKCGDWWNASYKAKREGRNK